MYCSWNTSIRCKIEIPSMQSLKGRTIHIRLSGAVQKWELPQRLSFHFSDHGCNFWRSPGTPRNNPKINTMCDIFSYPLALVFILFKYFSKCIANISNRNISANIWPKVWMSKGKNSQDPQNQRCNCFYDSRQHQILKTSRFCWFFEIDQVIQEENTDPACKCSVIARRSSVPP